MDIFRKTKKGQLHSYCIYLTSRYFETYFDFINLEFGCPRFEGNRFQFHYNPIPLQEDAIDFFPNIQTQYIYSKNDYIHKSSSIMKYSFQYQITYSEFLKHRDKLIQTPHGIIYTNEDKAMHGKRVPLQVTVIDNNLFEKATMSFLSLPRGLKEIRNRAFLNCSFLTSVTIPDNVTYVGHECFENCKSIKICYYQSKWKQWSNKCFSYSPYFSGFTLPPNCHTNKDIYNLVIPTFVTAIADYCFANSHKLFELTIPSSVVKIGKYAFAGCTDLKNIHFPSTLKQDQIDYGSFYKTPLLDHSKNECIIQNDRKQFNLTDEEKETIEQWTNMKIDHVLFDTSFDNWSIQSSLFDSIIHLKRSLLFIIEEEFEGIKFGAYINSQISKVNSNLVNSPSLWIPDGNCFLFRCNNVYGEMKQYDLRNEGGKYAFKLYPNTSPKLFKIGKSDIDIRKERFYSYCYQNEKSSFDYGNKYNCLVENTSFKPKRIVVIKMKDN